MLLFCEARGGASAITAAIHRGEGGSWFIFSDISRQMSGVWETNVMVNPKNKNTGRRHQRSVQFIFPSQYKNKLK